MRDGLLTGAALLVLAVGPAAAALAAPGDLHRVTAERVNLRAEPAEDAAVRRRLGPGEELLEDRLLPDFGHLAREHTSAGAPGPAA